MAAAIKALNAKIRSNPVCEFNPALWSWRNWVHCWVWREIANVCVIAV